MTIPHYNTFTLSCFTQLWCWEDADDDDDDLFTLIAFVRSFLYSRPDRFLTQGPACVRVDDVHC